MCRVALSSQKRIYPRGKDKSLLLQVGVKSPLLSQVGIKSPLLLQDGVNNFAHRVVLS